MIIRLSSGDLLVFGLTLRGRQKAYLDNHKVRSTAEQSARVSRMPCMHLVP